MPCGRVLSAAAGAIGLAIAVAACSHESPAVPSTVASDSGCTYVVSPTIVSAPTAGREVTVSVSTGPGCQWTASTSEPWIHVGTANRQGIGGFVMDVAVAPGEITGRRGTVTVSWAGGSRSIDVAQGCVVTQTVNLSPEKQNYLVSASAGCSFLTSPVSIDVPWISYVNSAFDNLITLPVDVNNGPERTGHVTTAIGQLTIVQRAGNCVTAIAPASQAFDERGGPG